MNVDARHSTVVDRLSQLATLSRLRNAVASGLSNESQQLLRELASAPVASTGDIWCRLHANLGRAVEALGSPSVAGTGPQEAVVRLRAAAADLLWASECLVEEPDARGWLDAWEKEWQQSLPPELATLFTADDAGFCAWLERGLGAEGAGVNAARLDSPAAPLAMDSSEASADDELLQAFLGEMDEGLRHAEELLLQFERSPGDQNLLHALFRQYHTLKGAAGAVDLQEAAEQLHQGEALLQALRDGELELPAPSVVDFFLRLGDSIRASIDEACGRKPTTEKIANLDDVIAALLTGEPARSPERMSSADNEAPPPSGEPSRALADGASSAAPTGVSALQKLREKAAKGLLDPEVVAMMEALQEKAEFFASMAATLQAEVEALRTVPAEDVFRRLARPLRDACRHEGKQVRLETAGGELRLPKELAEPLGDMLLHLVRNAVAHGVESPEMRRRRGKHPEGVVRVAIERNNGQWCVAVSDDGEGIDYEAIRRKALALGWLSPEEPCDEQRLESFLFRPGFSTRSVADAVAGRGVGMDVVATEVQKLEGSISIRSTRGHGTTVLIVLPSNTGGAHA